jgi:hypothetical protein
MPKRFELTAQLDHDVREVHAALTDARYWQGRLEGSATATLQIDSPDGPGSLRVTINERAEPADLPPVVRALARGPMIMERIDRWGPFDGNGATGEITGGTSGIPVTFRGQTRVPATSPSRSPLSDGRSLRSPPRCSPGSSNATATH